MQFSKLSLLIAATISAQAVAARDVPGNIRDFYQSITSQGQCNDVLAKGFYSKDGDGPGKISPPH